MLPQLVANVLIIALRRKLPPQLAVETRGLVAERPEMHERIDVHDENHKGCQRKESEKWQFDIESGCGPSKLL
jgi:hypothetical protein